MKEIYHEVLNKQLTPTFTDKSKVSSETKVVYKVNAAKICQDAKNFSMHQAYWFFLSLV